MTSWAPSRSQKHTAITINVNRTFNVKINLFTFYHNHPLGGLSGWLGFVGRCVDNVDIKIRDCWLV